MSSRWHGVHCTWQPHRPWNCPRESTACRGYKEARTSRESRREKTQGGHRRIHRPPGQARLVKRLRPFGFDPMRGQQKSDQPKPVALTCFGGPSGGQPAAQAAAAALRALRAALVNAHAFPQLRALSGSTPCMVKKKSDQPKPVALTCFGGPSGGRTLDLGIKSPLLYQLS